MAEPKETPLMEKIVSLCKRRGFVFQSSEIYGGINGFWDYGPLGAELKRNVKDLWWRTMVHEREDVAGLEATIIMAPQIWKASGHVDTFSDPMCDCLLTKKRFRADQIEPQSGIQHEFYGSVSSTDFRLLKDKNTLAAKLGDAFREVEYKQVFESFRSIDADTIEFNPPTPLEHYSATFKKYLPSFKSDFYAVLAPKGKPKEYAVEMAKRFYSERHVKEPVVFYHCHGPQENSTEFNPENGGLLSTPKPFNLMFKTYVGPVADEDNVAYLRPETAQAIFAQFKNVLETSRQKVPFGVAQVGKAFRNEVTPRNFTFRSREFEQMELEFFIKPDEAVEAICGNVARSEDAGRADLPVGQDAQQRVPTSNWGWEAWHKYWVEERIRFYEGIGLPRNTLVEYWQKPEELAHYARACVDILFKFPFSKRNEQGELIGEELEGIAARSDFDLSQHERFSGKPMGVFDEELRAAWGKLDDAKKADLSKRYYEARLKYLTKSGVDPAKAATEAKEDAEGLAKGQYIPHVIEPSAGVDRLILALICNAYHEDTMPDEKGNPETRVVMRFHPRVAPIKVAVLPLLKNKPDLVKKAREVRDLLRPHLAVFYDDAGAIGRRYRRQDEAGTPFCLTIDFDTLGEKGPELKDTVTVRHRDDGRQERLAISELLNWLLPKIR